MADIRPYEVARSLLIARLRKHGTSPAGIALAIEMCKRHLTDQALAAAAQRGEDPTTLVRTAGARTVRELEAEFTSGPDEPAARALESIKKVTGPGAW